MGVPIVATKLYRPPRRPGVVPRPRLSEQLNEGLALGRKLTLISAAAGFGKTTLVGDWVAGCGRAVAWLSLDEGDSEPARFIAYLIAALQTIQAGMGEGLLTVLHSPQPPPAEAILTALLNEIVTRFDNFILVLDDYHVVEVPAVNTALAFLVEHQPPQMHLVIATRKDPPLPLARLRARGQLTELRAADLRFTESETADFLNQVMGLNLTAADVSTLDKRIEGWVAGLQLAALSIKGQPDVQGFIRAFAGDHRYVVDYLVEEVLQRQPEAIRTFLLQTSILDQLNASLCEAVTAQPESKAQLDSLARGNLFVIPLDDKRHWYRYHHLFADVLRLHLQSEQPEQMPRLHQRASAWCERNNLTGEAIRHALAANDLQRAATLIERAVPEMRRSRQEAVLLKWLERLPDELVQRRPALGVHYVWALLAVGRLDGVETRLRDAEHWLENPTRQAAEMSVADEAEFRRLPAFIALYRAAYSMAQGKADETVTYAQQALAQIAADDFLGRGASAALLGLASWWRGNLNVAEPSYIEGMAMLQQAGYLSDAIGCALALADIQIAQGRLRDARHTYQRGLQLAATNGDIILRGAADMHVGLSTVCREQNDLDTAEKHLWASEKLGELAGLPQNRYRWCAALAGLRAAQGAFDEALEPLDEAERLYLGDLSPNIYPIAALKARAWLAQGRMEEARRWVNENQLSVKDEPNYLREFEQITLAKILLAGYEKNPSAEVFQELRGLLERLLKFAEAGGRMRSVIEILILQARTHHIQGDTLIALKSLEHALQLAEPEGQARVFLDEGIALTILLRKVIAKRGEAGYAGRVLAAFEAGHGSDEERPHLAASGSKGLIEPLSQRELDILRLFKSDLSGPEIAQKLVVALSTVRTHTKRIYAKLNVNNRRAAVRRAIELGLI